VVIKQALIMGLVMRATHAYIQMDVTGIYYNQDMALSFIALSLYAVMLMAFAVLILKLLQMMIQQLGIAHAVLTVQAG
jgi:hypothetical protein